MLSHALISSRHFSFPCYAPPKVKKRKKKKKALRIKVNIWLPGDVCWIGIMQQNQTKRKPAHKQWFEKKRHVCAEKRKKILAEDGGKKNKQHMQQSLHSIPLKQSVAVINSEKKKTRQKNTQHTSFFGFSQTLYVPLWVTSHFSGVLRV